VTSANKALLAHNAKTDPPPSFAKLLSGRRKHATESEHEDGERYLISSISAEVNFPLGSDSSLGGDLAPLDVAGTPEPEIKGETVVNSQGMKGKSTVSFCH
jgi:hypothetical protein